MASLRAPNKVSGYYADVKTGLSLRQVHISTGAISQIAVQGKRVATEQNLSLDRSECACAVQTTDVCCIDYARAIKLNIKNALHHNLFITLLLGFKA